MRATLVGHTPYSVKDGPQPAGHEWKNATFGLFLLPKSSDCPVVASTKQAWDGLDACDHQGLWVPG